MDVQLYDNLSEVPLPKRKADGHKGNFGKVLIIAGFGDMTGACVLCSEACLRAGAGLVKVYTSEVTAEVLRVRNPELMVTGFEKKADIEKIFELAKWADVIAVGPGLGTNDNARLAVESILQLTDKKFVLDADALNLLAEKMSGSIEKRLEGLNEILSPNSILTPHVAELSRLLGISVSELIKERDKYADIIGKSFNGTIVMKNAVTLTVSGSKRAENHHGNDGMAKGGSGDVLTGLIAAIRAQGAEDFEAAAAGVRIHAEAGDRAAAKRSRHTMLPTDMINEFDGIFKSLEQI